MENVDEKRFFIVKNEDKNIIFDIDSNIPIVANKKSDIGDLINRVEKSNKGLNKEVLKFSKYEDGSNLAINLNLTPACNLKCTYCFAQGGDYGQQGKRNMDENILDDLANIIINNVTKSRKVRFEYFGGEPLLNFNLIKKILVFCREFGEKENIKFIHRISTNLTYVNDEIIDALGENNFILSVSIDGNKEVQNILRPFKNNQGSYDIIIENIKKIRKKYPNIKIVARMTIAQKEQTMWENLKGLVSTGYFDYASIYPASIKTEDGSPYKYYFDNDIKEQFEYVIKNYNELLSLSGRFKGILEIEKILDQIINGKISVSHCGAGGTYCTISSDKSIVTCHRLCGKKEYSLNTTKNGVLNKELQLKWSRKVDNDNICSQCWARYICGGGCKQEHISATGSFENKNSNSCDYQKFLIGNIIKNIDILSNNFNDRYISLDDMFVYCGRAVVKNNRQEIMDSSIRYNK